MTPDGAYTAGRVPTLTEVIDVTDITDITRISEGHEAADRRKGHGSSPEPFAEAVHASPARLTAIDTPTADADSQRDDHIEQALAAALDRFDREAPTRLRAALQPILAEAADRLIAAARAELASGLRDLLGGTTANDPNTAPPDRRSADSPDA